MMTARSRVAFPQCDDILAKRDHKGLLVDKFHRFLNKAITIAVEDRGINDIFVAISVAV